MICPYRDKTETTIQKETYHLNEDNQNTGTDIVTTTIHQPMQGTTKHLMNMLDFQRL